MKVAQISSIPLITFFRITPSTSGLSSASIPVHMKLGLSSNTDASNEGTTPADTLNEIAEMFNLHFTSVFSERVSEDVSTNNVQPTVSGPCLVDFHFSCQDVTALKALNINKATGADEIPMHLLKETAEQIAPSSAQLFNISVYQVDLPEEWKLSKYSTCIHKRRQSTSGKLLTNISFINSNQSVGEIHSSPGPRTPKGPYKPCTTQF